MTTEITLQIGIVARTSTPPGALTGKAEAVELRDGGGAWESRRVGRAVAKIRELLTRWPAGGWEPRTEARRHISHNDFMAAPQTEGSIRKINVGGPATQPGEWGTS